MGSNKRNKAWRIHQTNRVIHKKLCFFGLSQYGWQGVSRRGYYLSPVERRRVNVIGDISILYSEKKHGKYKRWEEGYGVPLWKNKYYLHRARAKEKNRRDLNDEIGETYNFSYK